MKNSSILTFPFMCLFVLTMQAQPSSFYPRGIGGGGSLYFPSINPANDDEFYVSCDMSGLFHSIDFGNSYSLVDFQKLQVFGNSTYEFTNDPDFAYCNFNDGNDGYPVNTTDGGNSWSVITGYNMGNYGRVYSMKANYDNPLQLLIGGYGDILFSNNGGTSFSLVKHASDMGYGLIIGGVFWDGQNIYIGTNEGIIHSSNGGASFSVLPATGMASGQVIWSFAGAKVSGTMRFACIAANSGDVYNGLMPYDYYNFAKAVYVMDNASGTWVMKSAGIDFSNDFVMYLAMARNDINTIYLGGNDHAFFAPLVYRTLDGGSSWAKVFNTSNNANIITGWEGYNGDKNWSWSETCFGITVAPGNSSKVIFGSYSNAEVSSDGGNNWKQAYVKPGDQHPAGAPTPKFQPYHSIGLEPTSCWQVDWLDSTVMMGCYSDIGGIRSTDAGVTWGFQYTGFSVNTLYRVDQTINGMIFGGCSNIHDMYQSTHLRDATLDATDGAGKIVFSGDKGLTWSTVHVFNHPVYWLAIDPNIQNRMYASVIHFGGIQGSQAGGIYRTDNLGNLTGATWAKLPDPPRTEGHPAAIVVLNDGKMVCTYSGRINPAGAFTPSSGVFIYDPVQDSWTDVSAPGMYYWTQDIVIDPSDPFENTWYVCVYSGWGGPPNGLGGLYKTTDRGLNWTKLTGAQFDRVTSITFDPQHHEQAWLTTETQGLWFSANMTTSTPSWSLVAGYPFREPLRVFFNPYKLTEIWVTSFGNGIRTGSTIPTEVENHHTDLSGPGAFIYPDPVTTEGTIRILSAGAIENATVVIFDIAGTEIKRIKGINSREVKFDCRDLPKGPYLFSVIMNGKIFGTGKFMVK